MPSLEEVAADQELLLRCLGTGITATVSLAIKQLARLAKAGLLAAPIQLLNFTYATQV